MKIMIGIKTRELRPLHSASILLCAVSLSACASNPKKDQTYVTPSQLSLSVEDTVDPSPAQREKRLRERLAAGVIDGTVLAAKGTALVAKKAVTITADGAELVAKGTVAGAKISGKAALGTGEILLDGTRRTASGVRSGIEFITKAPATKDAANPVGNKTFADAALSPLADFNIRKRERPEILMRLEAEDIYQIEANAGCEWYDVRIQELDEVLGDDYDVQKEETSPLEDVGNNARSAALSGVASEMGSYVPGRGIVRALSGAQARQKQTRKIYQKGVARRSFLKGAAVSAGCKDSNLSAE